MEAIQISVESSVKPYKDSERDKKQQVEQMFDTISGNYDQLNKVISLGRDRAWRRKVINLVMQANPANYLDIATGTGDLAIKAAMRSDNIKIVGLDLSEGMLSIAEKKASEHGLSKHLSFLKGDSESLPFESNSFDAITVAFGIRNFEDLHAGLTDICRVLRPGGRLVILETSVPTKFPFRQGYYIYARCLVPLIGRIFSKDKTAYQYLSESASVFPHGEALNNILRKNGFIEVENKPQTFGVATIYTATK